MTAPTTKSYPRIPVRRDRVTKSDLLLAAVRRGADADEINALLAEIRQEQRLRRDAARVAELAAHIARGELPTVGLNDLAALLSITRQTLEEIAPLTPSRSAVVWRRVCA